jgi:uncharacterized protein YkvS
MNVESFWNSCLYSVPVEKANEGCNWNVIKIYNNYKNLIVSSKTKTFYDQKNIKIIRAACLFGITEIASEQLFIKIS